MKALPGYADFIGRVLMSVLFLVAGLGKLGAGYEPTQAYMAAHGVPTALLPLVIATELVGGIAIVIGYKTRIVAFLLAGFTLLTALFFHSNFGQPMQNIMFMKNLAIAGGFLFLVVNGAGRFSLDHVLNKSA